jgi:hypothetical protein
MLQLQNTLIIWLPPNSTSHFQPLDQGIIRTWKAYWKQKWVRYLVEEYGAGQDPVASMHILQALRWGIAAWELDLKSSTIERCFRKALHDPTPSAAVTDPEPVRDIENGLAQLQMSNRIHNIMDIQQFLNPADEAIDDSLDQLDSQVLAAFEPEVEDDSDEELESLPKISNTEALSALRSLRLYGEQQVNGKKAIIQALNEHEKDIQGRWAAQGVQRDIRSYLL